MLRAGQFSPTKALRRPRAARRDDRKASKVSIIQVLAWDLSVPIKRSSAARAQALDKTWA